MEAIRCKITGPPTIASWASLSADILGLVLCLLAPDELLAASAVCRTWHRAASADALWARHLAPLVQPPEAPETLFAMLKTGALAPLSLRDHYALCKSMGRKISNFVGSEWRHLCVVRQAARYGFDPLRHIAPTWTNAMRLLRLFVFGGTPALTAVANTCRTHGSFACRRGRKLRALFRRTLYLAPTIVIACCAASVLWFAAYRSAWLARSAALSVFLSTLAVTLACYVNGEGPRVSLALLISYLFVMWSFGAYLPLSSKAVVCRLIVGVVVGIPYKCLLKPSNANLLVACVAACAILDFMVPLILFAPLCVGLADVRLLRRSLFRVLQSD